MSKPDSILFCIAVILNLCFWEGCGDESDEEVYPNYEYTQIFKGVPAFFEYLLNALEEKPEMLEKNDVSIFKRETVTDNDNINKENKIDQDQAYESSKEEQADNCEAETAERSKRKDSVDVREPPRTVAYEYGNSILKRGSNEDKCKIKAKKEAHNANIKSFRKDKLLKRKMQKRSIDEGDELYLDFSEPGYKEYEEVVWGNDEGYLGFQDLFGLDVQPQEIKEGILMTEKLLEDYNYKRMTSG